jgi:hypothetical protein
MGPMIEEEIRRKIPEKRQERIPLRDDGRVEETEYRTYMDKVEKLGEQPFVPEITLIEQTMAFFAGWLQVPGCEDQGVSRGPRKGPPGPDGDHRHVLECHRQAEAAAVGSVR